MNMVSKTIDYDYDYDYDSYGVDYDYEFETRNPDENYSNDMFDSFDSSYIEDDYDSNVESNSLSSDEKKYWNWIYSDTDIISKKKTFYPYPILPNGEIITKSKLLLHLNHLIEMQKVEEKIVYLQNEIEKHNIILSIEEFRKKLPKLSEERLKKENVLNKMKEEQKKIDEENKKIIQKNNMDMMKNINKDKINKKNTVFKSNVKVISESVILERRKEKKRIRAIEKKAEKIQEEINSKKLKEEMNLEKEKKKKEKDSYTEELINSIKEDKLSDNKKNMINDLEIVIKKLDAVKEIEVALEIEDKKEQKIVKKTINKGVDGWSITMSRVSGSDKKERVKFLCESIISKTKCRHGDKCNFSHVISACPFGVKCLNVEKKDNAYINKGSKICTFTHLNETIEDFEIRVNKQNKKTSSSGCDSVSSGCVLEEAVSDGGVPNKIKKEIVAYGRPIDSNNTWSNIASIGVKPKAVSEGGEKKNIEEKKSVIITLNKTQMCNSVSSNIKCRHGDKCRYAHSKEELVCGYGDSCTSNNCNRIHSSPRHIIKEEVKVAVISIDIPSKKSEPEKSKHEIKTIFKTQLCNSLESNIKCRHGDNCRYAHSEEELVCGYGDSCTSNNCNRIHSSPINKVVNKEVTSDRNITGFNTNAKVKLCAFIGRCKNGVNCKYSHTASQPLECGYGNQCKKVCWDGYKYINISNTLCDRRHPYENNILYKYRCSK
ncbi:hypothetical protein Indivirus_14_4 [Indivirus ILV1]|uniref:C3H1-type domain-containing protein n=1 Tax=Indivirus ILV1 TaxID=1977633 RepID=A0A1V0SEE5_9VIRU|nr:hypothetical protein Indivirus_14_4 [Indivirus ILV1]